MIKIDDKHNCCGCAACVQICPKQCISFEEDKKGFCYPIVNTELCVDCKLCERVCPVINPHSSHKPTKVYAAKISNEAIRLQSSSGGIFTALAETIINDGGVVFGVGFDSNWEVEHKYTDTLDGLSAFRGSKYVQSRVGKTYKQVQEFLHQGRKVLFSGTPCQIAGLHKFLGMRYDNLMTVDVVCHGVPSPLVWRAYLDYVLADGRRYISAICFRDKATGWKKFSFSIKSSLSEVPLIMEKHSSNCYMQFYLNNLSLRPS